MTFNALSRCICLAPCFGVLRIVQQNVQQITAKKLTKDGRIEFCLLLKSTDYSPSSSPMRPLKRQLATERLKITTSLQYRFPPKADAD
ncbi:hypothetical protein Jann_3535 [Jannaschia sp. CCS1]|nr:hypothetical protein Jann_3535 [Jannaschia sp. CCS1]